MCGDELELLPNPVNTMCDYCGRKTNISHECRSSHYICDLCYHLSAHDLISETCLKYAGIDPIELAIQIMNSPVIKMHGSEHHFIVPAVLLTCAYNLKGLRHRLEDNLGLIYERTKSETSTYCTFKAGTCGAAFGAGVFLSVFNDRTAYSEDEWSEANHIISESLKRVAASPGPRCCKRDTYLTILASIDFLKEKYSLELPISNPKCTFSLRNKNCGREECEFYNLSNTLV